MFATIAEQFPTLTHEQIGILMNEMLLQNRNEN